jgi:hypothetical protein
MLALFVNGNHIGDLRNTYAYEMAMLMCSKVGDSAVLYTIDHYDHMPEMCHRIYYRNSLGVQESDPDPDLDYYNPEMWDKVEKEPIITHKLRDKVYAKSHTERSYAESDHHRYRIGSEGYMSYVKRQERRAARKLGKEHIKEQLAA